MSLVNIYLQEIQERLKLKINSLTVRLKYADIINVYLRNKFDTCCDKYVFTIHCIGLSYPK